MANYYDVVPMLRSVNKAIAETWPCNDKGWTNQPPKLLRQRRGDVWSTAEGVLWLLEYDKDKYAQNIAEGASRLIALRHTASNRAEVTDGGWGAQLKGDSDAVGTALALLALARYAKFIQLPKSGDIPAEYLDAMTESRDWLVRALRVHDGWGSDPDRPSAFGMCWGCLALQECMELVFDPRASTALNQVALPRIMASQVGGGWAEFLGKSPVAMDTPDAIGTAYCTYLLQSGDNATNAQCVEPARAGIRWLIEHKKNGIWPVKVGKSPIEAAAWASMALLAAEEVAEAEDAVTYLESVCDPNLGWPDYPGPKAEARFYTTYFAARALLQYRDAWQRSRILPPSLDGNRVFIIRLIRQSSNSNVQPIIDEVQQLVDKCGLKPVVVEAETAEALTGSIETKAKQDGIDYAVVLVEDVIGRPGAVLQVAAKLSREIDHPFITLLYTGQSMVPQELSRVNLVSVREADWSGQIKSNMQKARLIVTD